MCFDANNYCLNLHRETFRKERKGADDDGRQLYCGDTGVNWRTTGPGRGILKRHMYNFENNIIYVFHVINNSERPVDALAEKYHLLTD